MLLDVRCIDNADCSHQKQSRFLRELLSGRAGALALIRRVPKLRPLGIILPHAAVVSNGVRRRANR